MGIETLLLGAAVVGTAGSIYSTTKAAKASKQAAQAEQRRAEVQNIRNVRQSIREARLAQGSLVAQGANAGTVGSTGVAGGVASVGAQLGGNLNYLAQIAEENTNIFNAQMKAAQAQSNASIFGAVGNLASQGYQGVTGKTVGQELGIQLKKLTK